MELGFLKIVKLPHIGGKKLATVVGAVFVIAAAVLIGKSMGGDSSSGSNNLLIVPRAVEKRTLEDVLSVTGEVRRDETKKINSPVDGQISDVSVEDGAVR